MQRITHPFCSLAAIGLLLSLMLVPGCAQVDYLGSTYPASSKVDVYDYQAMPKLPHRVIGTAQVAFEAPKSREYLHNVFAQEAKRRGADALVIAAVDPAQRRALATFIRWD